MAIVRREIYASSNGDRWFLSRDDAGLAFVMHEPNVASGGHRSHIDIGTFLARGPKSPEALALLRMIGALAEDAAS